MTVNNVGTMTQSPRSYMYDFDKHTYNVTNDNMSPYNAAGNGHGGHKKKKKSSKFYLI